MQASSLEREEPRSDYEVLLSISVSGYGWFGSVLKEACTVGSPSISSCQR